MRDPLALPERIAFAGDWHGNASWAVSAIIDAAERGADVLIHLGDFGYMFQPRFLGDVGEALEQASMPLLFVEGNHENHTWLNRQPLAPNGLRLLNRAIWHLPRGHRWEWGGVRFVALGGAHSVDGIWRRQAGHMWHKEERITDEQAAAVSAAGRADVLVAHDCPDGVPIPGLTPDAFPLVEILRSDEHRRLLRGVVDQVQPRAIWHGHYHVRYDATVDLGYGPVQVTGLDMDGTDLARNVQTVDLDELARLVQVGL